MFTQFASGNAKVIYFIQYYQQMGWTLQPWFLLEYCQEACYEDDNDFGWRTCTNAIRYLKEQQGIIDYETIRY